MVDSRREQQVRRVRVPLRGGRRPPRPTAECGAVVELVARLAQTDPTGAARRALDQLLASLAVLLPEDAETWFGDAGGSWRRAPPQGDPPAQFVVGNEPGESGRSGRGKRHPAYLRGPFWIGATPVTAGQYRLLDPGYGRASGLADRMPAIDVSWFEARLFARWLDFQLRCGQAKQAAARVLPAAALGHYRVDLPTEGEWEYACHVGDEHRASLPCSRTDPDAVLRVAWTAENSGLELQPVAKRPDAANAWGVHDMLGNVWEWTRADPDEPRADAREVLRGGSFADPVSNCRSTRRFQVEPALATDVFGFRLALVPECSQLPRRPSG